MNELIYYTKPPHKTIVFYSFPSLKFFSLLFTDGNLSFEFVSLLAFLRACQHTLHQLHAILNVSFTHGLNVALRVFLILLQTEFLRHIFILVWCFVEIDAGDALILLVEVGPLLNGRVNLCLKLNHVFLE